MAQAMSLLALWTNVGGGVGSAISAALWNRALPKYLNEELGSVMNSTQIAEIYGSIVVARYAEPRPQVIQGECGTFRQTLSSTAEKTFVCPTAYNRAMTDLLLPSMLLCFVPLLGGFLTREYILDNKHNAIEDKEIVLRDEAEVERDLQVKKTQNRVE